MNTRAKALSSFSIFPRCYTLKHPENRTQFAHKNRTQIPPSRRHGPFFRLSCRRRPVLCVNLCANFSGPPCPHRCRWSGPPGRLAARPRCRHGRSAAAAQGTSPEDRACALWGAPGGRRRPTLREDPRPCGRLRADRAAWRILPEDVGSVLRARGPAARPALTAAAGPVHPGGLQFARGVGMAAVPRPPKGPAPRTAPVPCGARLVAAAGQLCGKILDRAADFALIGPPARSWQSAWESFCGPEDRRPALPSPLPLVRSTRAACSSPPAPAWQQCRGRPGDQHRGPRLCPA